MACGCDDKCELPKALQINNPGEVILFHRVEIPASQGDDETYPPKNGLYRNVLLVYLANNHSYLYSSDGIPTRVSGDVGVGVPEGGATGQILTKKTDVDYDTEWTTQISANDAKLTLTRNSTEIGDFTANASVDKTIDIEVPTKTSDLVNDGATGESTYAEATDIADIWEEIEEIEAASDVTDVVGTYAELEAYDTSKLKDNDIIKVLEDETQNDQITYYRWDTDTETFTLIGAIGPYYTKSEADSEFVPQTRTINDKALSSDISLTASDVGALPDSTSIPTKTSDLANDGADGTSTYVEADDYATANAAGVVKVTSAFGTEMSNSGELKGAVVSTSDYGSMWNDALVSKGTLENALSTKINNATLTVTQNGTSKGTFTANSSTDTTIALTDTTYSDFAGATSGTAGSHGLVPAPTTSDPDKFLKGDGTWGTPPGTTYTAGTGIDISGSTIAVDNTIATKTDVNGKVDIASIDLTGQSTTLLTLTKALGTNHTDYARWECMTDIGSANILDKPTGSSNASFVCEAYCNRWAANNDYRYELVCYVKDDPIPYVSYIKNDSTGIGWTKLQYRYKQSTYNSSANSWYYPIATLPIDNSGNSSSVIINGRIGGWTNANMAKLDLLLTNRSNYTGDNITASGSIKGPYTGAFSMCNVVVYKQTDKSAIVYLKCDSYFAFDLFVDYYQATPAWTGSYTTSPSGTLIWASNTTKALEYVDTEGRISKVREMYDHFTSRQASANTTATGNGGLYKFQATSTMTTGKPKSDAHLLQLEWDNTGGHDAQLAISTTSSNNWLAHRSQTSGTWGNWIYTLDDVADSVKTTNIAALAVTTAKIADGAVTADKIDGDVAYIDDPTTTETETPWVTTGMIADDAVTPDKASFTEYSTTTDMQVGTWNGKPLYRHISQFTTPSSQYTYTLVDTGLPATTDFAFIENGFVANDSEGWVMPINGIRCDSDSTVMGFMTLWVRLQSRSSGYNKFAVSAASSVKGLPATVMILYTKSTD